MVFNWFKSKQMQTQMGIYLKAHEVIILQLNKDGTPTQYSAKITSSEGWNAAIASLVNEHKLHAHPCQLILSSGYYQKYTIDKPQVPDNELAAAIPWALKDIASDALHDIVCDFYTAPAVSNSGEKLNVVTAKRSLIASLVNTCQEQHLSLNGISTDEMALCNLLGNTDETTILLTQEPGEELSLITVKAQQLLFNRRLRGFNQLPTIEANQIDELLIDNLSLELQRSVDYLIAQLKQTDIKQINIAISTPALADICSALSAVFSLPVVAFTHPQQQKQENLIALGGALEQYHD